MIMRYKRQSDEVFECNEWRVMAHTGLEIMRRGWSYESLLKGVGVQEFLKKLRKRALTLRFD
jgi:hypothetical protein